jgi:CO dehydrogenase/acetyl-CoA synthase delta subunit
MSEGFGNTTELVSVIEYVQLSANKTIRRIEAVLLNVADQLMDDLRHVASIHCSLRSRCQGHRSNRMVFSESCPKKEILTMVTWKAKLEAYSKSKLLSQKLGAPAIAGSRNRVVGLGGEEE